MAVVVAAASITRTNTDEVAVVEEEVVVVGPLPPSNQTRLRQKVVGPMMIYSVCCNDSMESPMEPITIWILP